MFIAVFFFIIIIVIVFLTTRSAKRKGRVVFNGKAYELVDPKWESNERVGVNCDADHEPYYRGQDGNIYTKGEIFSNNEIPYTSKEVYRLLAEARYDIRNLKDRIEALERKTANDPSPASSPPTPNKQ
jgi:hypothetical protein